MKCVYIPSDDTYILLSALCKDLGSKLSNLKILELGSGSGIVTTYLASLGAEVISIDISPYAVVNTIINLRKNNLQKFSHVIQGSGVKLLVSRKIFDIIIFNPPYIPCRKDNDWYDLSLCGLETHTVLLVTFKYFCSVLLDSNEASARYVGES